MSNLTKEQIKNFDYSKAEYEDLPCNFCGSRNSYLLSDKDKYGLPTKTVLCKKCGLIYINPRMKKEYYDKFYNCEYRNIIATHKPFKKEKDHNSRFESARKTGRKLGELAKGIIKPGFTIEVGSSVGGILKGFKEIIDCEVLGIEPSLEEAEYAEQKGIKTKVSLLENLNSDLPMARNILSVRALNHLLDPKYFFRWANENLEMGGHIIVMVLNFAEFCKKRGAVVTQIDHPFMFTPASLKNFTVAEGFKIDLLKTEGNYIFLIAKKSRRHSLKLFSRGCCSYAKTRFTFNRAVLTLCNYWFRIKRKFKSFFIEQ